MNGRVDVVAAPIRYRRMPLLALLVVAVIPAAGLFIAQDRLDAEADRYEATRDAVAELEASSGRVQADDGSEDVAAGEDVGGPSDPAESGDTDGDALSANDLVLNTGLFDYRRIPETVADLANASRLAVAVDPIKVFLADTSCYAVSVNGVPVAGFNQSLAVIPASTMKLLVAATALEILGPDYTFTTSVATPIANDGVIEGDVFLVGGGDPVLTSDDYPIEDDAQPAFSTTSLDRLADAFVASGIERIQGTVIGDGSRYDDEWVVEGWADDVPFVEAGPYDALLANDARVLGRSGRQDDPNSGAARELARLLGNRGIEVTDGWGSGTASSAVRVIGSVESAPLADIVAEMLTTSDNNTAEMLVKEIGVVASGSGSRVAGLAAIMDTLNAWGAPTEGIELFDGSGLHPRNQLTCALLLDVLQQSRGTSLPDGLAIAGSTGTLSGEFIDTTMEGVLAGKTGTLGNPPIDEPPLAVKALAGYVRADADADDAIEFVMVLNADEVPQQDYQRLWEAFGDRLATYPAGPDAADLGPR